MTIREFVLKLWENDPNGSTTERLDLDTARIDLDNFRADGWDLPEGITPESYAEAWNELVNEASPRTYRDYFSENEDENLSWCKPYASEDGHVFVIMHDGKLTGLFRDGTRTYATPEAIRALAQELNPDYADYRGWDDTHILLEVMQEVGCASCPWFRDCQVMDEELGS